MTSQQGPIVRTQKTGLRAEIIITLAFLFGSSLLLGGFLFLRYTEQNLVQQRIEMTSLGLRLVALNLVDNRQVENRPESNILFSMQNQLNAQSWWYFDRDLNLDSSYVTASSEEISKGMLRQIILERDEVVELSWPGLLSFFNAKEDSSLLVAVPVEAAGGIQGVLAARFPLEDIHHKLVVAQRWLLIYVVAFGTVLVFSGLYLLDRNIVRPTRKLLEATRDIATGNLNLHLEKTGPLEIAALADSFNAMVDALQTSRDETENHIVSLHAANIELQQTQSELIRSEKLATVGYIAAGMAHEIGNPLGALTGYLSLLQKDLAQSPQSELVIQASAAADRIDRLVRELLDYSAPTDLCVEAIDPWAVVAESVQLLESQGVFKGVQVSYDHALVLPSIRIDRHKLGQVLVNLLLNSKDACLSGGGITVTGQEEEESVIIRVIDSGCGIPADQLDTVFVPFFTTKAPGMGRGLGLAICQRIVAEAQGTIRCDSILGGQGCTFTLSLPKA